MELRPLGRTGVQVSKLCLGTMMFGAWGNTDHDDSIRVIHRVLDAGINLVDTADVYSGGESEEIAGSSPRRRARCGASAPTGSTSTRCSVPIRTPTSTSTLIELAVSFVVSHPAVTSAIIGPRTMEQLDSQLPAAEVVLDAASLDRIDEIVPGSPPPPAPKGASMQITQSSIETQKGPADWFTGDVYIDAVAVPAGTSTFAAALVHFTPGARTAWHTHPHGQTIFVTEGVGVCQREGGPIEVIRPGDRAFFEPGENHWHGAAPNRFMVHIAMQQTDESGSPVTWGEHVSDEEYAAAPTP